jgi:uncharacterized membrane protein YidH (DUF202 family)
MHEQNEGTPILPYRIRIGVTGHRRLADPEGIAELVRMALAKDVEALFDPDSLQSIRDASEWAPVQFASVSALAEGADRLVAREVLATPGATLEAVLPLAMKDYLATFDAGSDDQEFHGLLAQCRNPLWLRTHNMEPDISPDEARKTKHRAYSKVGRYIVDHCDVLIAIWDGEPPRGPGGTAEVVAYAKEVSRPVIRIWTDRETPEVTRGHGLNAESLHGMHLFRSFHVSAEESRHEMQKLEAEYFKKPVEGIPPQAVESIRQNLFPFYLRASAMAKENQTAYKRAGTLGYYLSAAAVAAVALGTLFEEYALFAFGAELLFLIVILTVVGLAEHHQNSEKWMESRFLTERLRASIYMAACGVEVSPIRVPPFMGQAEHPDDWMVRVFNEIWNRMPPLIPCSEQNCTQLAAYVTEGWVREQIAFHRGKTKREGEKGARLRFYSKTLAWITVGAALGHLGLGLLSHHGAHKELEDLLTFIAISFPALAAALAALRSHREHARLERRSANMIPRLTQLASLVMVVGAPADFVEALREVEATMLQEAQDWLMLMRFVAIDAG